MMRLSTFFGRTLREAPGEADHIPHQLVLRAGLARSHQAGSYALLPLGMRVLRRIEAIMHEEMARIGGQEFRTPVIQSAEPWKETGRYEAYGPMMLTLVDRNDRQLIVAPTHEEAVAELARREIQSHRQLPIMLYQIHTKYRDEVRARGGLLRMREFTMLDAYSLDGNFEGLNRAYDAAAEAFERVLTRCGVEFVAVQAGGGEMGSGEAREYMVLSSAGEDLLVLCSACDYAANLEVAVSAPPPGAQVVDVPPAERVATPGCATIAAVADYLGVPQSVTAKAVFFDSPERGLLFVVVRGDLEVNEGKLRAVAGVSALAPATAEQIEAVGAVAGYASPVGLEGVTVVADESVAQGEPLVAGANEHGYHLKNVLYERDWTATTVADITTVREGDHCARCGSPLRLERAIEVGHVFKLGTRYSAALGATFLDAHGGSQPVVMGSYGIGLERLMQVIVEQHHDEHGIRWPAAVAPFAAQLLRIGKSDDVRAAADDLYAALLRADVQVLYDDRDETAGVKFKDADLLGAPLRLVVSQRLAGEESVEIKPRTGDASQVTREAIVEVVREALGKVTSGALDAAE